MLVEAGEREHGSRRRARVGSSLSVGPRYEFALTFRSGVKDRSHLIGMFPVDTFNSLNKLQVIQSESLLG